MSDIKAYVVHILRYCDVEKILNIGKTILCSVQYTKLWVTKKQTRKNGANQKGAKSWAMPIKILTKKSANSKTWNIKNEFEWFEILKNWQIF